eukprot:2662682-Amphidinium_carterae.1
MKRPANPRPSLAETQSLGISQFMQVAFDLYRADDVVQVRGMGLAVVSSLASLGACIADCSNRTREHQGDYV